MIYGKICDVETGKVAHGLLGMYGQDFFCRAQAAGAFFFKETRVLEKTTLFFVEKTFFKFF